MQFLTVKLLYRVRIFNPLSTNPKKWSNTLKQFVANLSKNRLSVFDHFVILALDIDHFAFEYFVILIIFG